MLIKVNGESREVDEGTTLRKLIIDLALKPDQVAIELNREVVRRVKWEETILQEGDTVEIVHFVGGG